MIESFSPYIFHTEVTCIKKWSWGIKCSESRICQGSANCNKLIAYLLKKPNIPFSCFTAYMIWDESGHCNNWGSHLRNPRPSAFAAGTRVIVKDEWGWGRKPRAHGLGWRNGAFAWWQNFPAFTHTVYATESHINRYLAHYIREKTSICKGGGVPNSWSKVSQTGNSNIQILLPPIAVVSVPTWLWGW